MKRKTGNARRKRICTAIIGIPVINVYYGSDLPARCCIATVGPKDVYLVNFRHRKALHYIDKGKFLWKRVYGKLHVRLVPKPKSDASKLNEDYIKAAEKLRMDVAADARESRFDRVEREVHDFTHMYGDWSDLT